MCWINMRAWSCALMQMSMEKNMSARVYVCVKEYPRFRNSVHACTPVRESMYVTVMFAYRHCSLRKRRPTLWCPPAGPMPDWIMGTIQGSLTGESWPSELWDISWPLLILLLPLAAGLGYTIWKERAERAATLVVRPALRRIKNAFPCHWLFISCERYFKHLLNVLFIP